VKTGVQRIYNPLKRLGSGACPGPDPGFAGMTQKGIFRLFAKPSYEAGYPKGGKIGIGRLLKLFRPATEWKKRTYPFD
jgi:hypothetical protein